MSDTPPPTQCPTPEADTLVDVGLRLLGAIEKLMGKLDVLLDAQFEYYDADES